MIEIGARKERDHKKRVLIETGFRIRTFTSKIPELMIGLVIGVMIDFSS